MSYKGTHLDCGYRVDLVVGDALLVEVKSVERLLPIHQAQVLTYLRLLNIPQGLLINFNDSRLTDGLRNVLLSQPRQVTDESKVIESAEEI